jgi:hypothetical protein
VAGCHLLGDVEDLTIVEDGSGAGTGTATGTGTPGGTSTGSTTTSDTGGQTPVCEPENCPGDDSECGVRACVNGLCDFQPTGIGIGCLGTQFCDGQGACVECIDNQNWPCPEALPCQNFVCVAASCDDGLQNNTETGLDCGGACGPCPVGEGCLGPGDCLTLRCNVDTCATCSSHSECPSAHYCDADLSCKPQKGTWLPCSADAADWECTTGNCETSVIACWSLNPCCVPW